MFLICVKVHLNTERIPPIDEPRGRLWRFSSTDYTKRGNFVVLLRLSGTLLSGSFLATTGGRAFLGPRPPLFLPFFCESGLSAEKTQNGTAHEEGSPVQFVQGSPQGMSGSGRSLVRSVCSVLLGCRIFFEHFKESLLFAVAAKLLEETCNHKGRRAGAPPPRTAGPSSAKPQSAR